MKAKRTPLAQLSENNASHIRIALSTRRWELINAWLVCQLGGKTDENGAEFWAIRIRGLNDAAIALGCAYQALDDYLS